MVYKVSNLLSEYVLKVRIGGLLAVPLSAAADLPAFELLGFGRGQEYTLKGT